jgi:hypothetical protein
MCVAVPVVSEGGFFSASRFDVVGSVDSRF